MKIHLARLAEMEFLLPHKGGHKQSFVYELLYTGEDAEGRARLLGLIEVGSLHALPTTASGRGEEPLRSGCGRPAVGVRSGGGRGAVAPQEPKADEALSGVREARFENAPPEILVPVLSYANGVAR
jgi:hypothetical protein